ncbi:neuronal acetylcholine receptor subunit eat-2-like [Physella acuta]|uniref:neuronal acetylcholine receptor subunit eat-2-like n=1 Tax=Physella acuta TaxID=109671 RepID=UPI0027DBA540|nr:neuronal acetylcholine receptor subunit eat-2-like [Physella acuta]
MVLLIGPAFCSDSGSQDVMDHYAALTQDLLSRRVVVYKIPPELVSHQTAPFVLKYQLIPIDVLGIDDIDQVMTLIIHLEVVWFQPNITWDPADHGNITQILLDSNLLWKPDIILVVGHKDSISLPSPDTLMVQFDGTVTYRIDEYISFRCKINFDKFPFDSQVCWFGLYYNPMLNSTIVEIQVDDMFREYSKNFQTQPYIIASEWSLDGYHYDIRSDLNNLQYPRYQVKVTRRYTFYLITVISPMILTSAMILFVFLVPPETGEKFSYLVSLFTSQAIFLNFICDVMPRGLSSIPYLAILLMEVILEGILAIAATAWVMKKYAEEKKVSSFSILGACTKNNKVAPADDQPASRLPDKTEDVTSPEVKDTNPISATSTFLTSRKLDTIFFFTFTFAQVLFLVVLFQATEWFA